MSFIGTLSQTLTLRAAFCPPPICCRKYPAPLVSIPLTPFSRGRSGPSGFPSPRGFPCPPAPAWHLMMPWLLFDVASSLCLVLKKVYHSRIHDATRKPLIINTIGVFRVGFFTTLKTVKQLSLSNLQVALRPLDNGAMVGQQCCPREDLPPWSCFFIGTLSQTLTLRAFLFNPPPRPPFQGGDQGLWAFHRLWAFPARQLRPGI